MEYESVDQRLINLNSVNATKKNSDYLSNVIFNFNNVLYNDPSINYVTIGLLNAQIPVSFYTINDTNNTLTFRVAPNTNQTFNVTNGNYNANTLITELKTQFTNLGYTNIEITISKITGILTFTNVGSSTLFVFRGGSTILPVLGFVMGTDYQGSPNSIIAPYPLNLLGIKKLKINSVALSTSSFDSKTNGIVPNLAVIPVNVASFGLIDYVNNSNIFPISLAKTIDAIDINILDENDNYIDFNNVNWTMTIQMNIYRKQTKTNSEIVDTLKYIAQELGPQSTTQDLGPLPTTQENNQQNLSLDDQLYNGEL